MLEDIFNKQRTYIDAYFNTFDVKTVGPLLEKILQSKGVVFTTGVGKSGFIAQKIAATLMSTGTKAFFLPPIDALHGDLGMLSKEDIVLILSKSGESDELLHLLPFVRSKGAFLTAVTCNAESRLSKACDYSIFLPCKAELCPFDLAPTTSTEIHLLFGDLLAIALMETKKFSLKDFALNHPGGQIGRRSSLRVRDLMLDRERTPFCYPHDLLEDVLRDFSDKRCGCLIVIDQEKKLKGIFTDGDLRRALQSKGEKILKEQMINLMTPTPRSIEVDSFAWDAMKLMESDQRYPIMVLPVLDKKEVIGIIKMHDLIQSGL